MIINTTPTAPVTVNGEPLEFLQGFTYLGSLSSKDNGGQKGIKARLGKARCAFAKLQNFWKSNQYTTKTKIRLYNSNVKSILLYGSECWRVVKGDMINQTQTTKMARACSANAPRQHPQSGTEMDTTWKKETRTAKDDMATICNSRAERDGAVLG